MGGLTQEFGTIKMYSRRQLPLAASVPVGSFSSYQRSCGLYQISSCLPSSKWPIETLAQIHTQIDWWTALCSNVSFACLYVLFKLAWWQIYFVNDKLKNWGQCVIMYSDIHYGHFRLLWIYFEKYKAVLWQLATSTATCIYTRATSSWIAPTSVFQYGSHSDQAL